MKILRLRKEKGITQTDLAEACGISQQHVAKIESGVVDPQLSTLRKIAEALDCDVSDLFFTRVEFEQLVNAVVKRHGLNLEQMIRNYEFVKLTNLCRKEEYIGGYSPFWEQVKVVKNKITLQGTTK